MRFIFRELNPITMKKIYAIAGALVFAGSLSAQLVDQAIPKAKAPKLITNSKPNAHYNVMKGACVLSEDFEGGAIPAGWDIGPDVEQQDNNNIGLGTFVPAWVVGTGLDANNGTYLPIPDVPPGNLIAYANDDGPPCNCDMGLVRLSTPEMDFSGMTNMSIGYNAYNDAGFGGGNMEIAVSIDQGATWTVVETLAPFQGVWQSVVTNLSAYDGESSVMVGFQWADNGEWATGVGVDNVCVAQILDYNMTMVEPFMADVLGPWNDPSIQSLQYTFLALDQAISTVVGGAVRNNGGMDMTNVIVDCEVFVDGASQGTFSSPPVAVMAPGQMDTVLFDTGWMPSAAGMVEYAMSVRADSTDMGPGDNAASIDQLVTDNDGGQILGRDNNSAESFTGNTGNVFKYGNDFKITADAQVYGMLVCVGEGAGAIIQGQLLDGNLDAIDITEDYELTVDDENGATGNTMTYLPFSIPVDVVAEELYTAVVEHFGGGIDITIANSGSAPEQTTSFQDETATWFYTTSTPMVRLVMAENSLGIEDDAFENGVRVGPNMPNPFGDNTIITYELQEGSNVQFTVVDVNGKLVFDSEEGNKPAGIHIIEFDGSYLANGLYTYTIATENSRISKRMIVTH